MTDYAGEKYRIETRKEKDFDGVALVPASVDHVQVQIYAIDAQGALADKLVDETMDWDEDVSHWVYEWNTAAHAPAVDAVPAGTYKYFVIFWDLDLTFSIEGPFRIRLKTDPRP